VIVNLCILGSHCQWLYGVVVSNYSVPQHTNTDCLLDNSRSHGYAKAQIANSWTSQLMDRRNCRLVILQTGDPAGHLADAATNNAPTSLYTVFQKLDHQTHGGTFVKS